MQLLGNAATPAGLQALGDPGHQAELRDRYSDHYPGGEDGDGNRTGRNGTETTGRNGRNGTGWDGNGTGKERDGTDGTVGRMASNGWSGVEG